MELSSADVPVVSVVTRLTHQKGIHLIKHAAWRALERGGQFVLLGSAPDPRVQVNPPPPPHSHRLSFQKTTEGLCRLTWAEWMGDGGGRGGYALLISPGSCPPCISIEQLNSPFIQHQWLGHPPLRLNLTLTICDVSVMIGCVRSGVQLLVFHMGT